MGSREYLTSIVLLCAVVSLGTSSCRSAGLGVKVYQHQDGVGMVRGQDNEVVTYRDANGWFCMNPEDFRKVVEFIDACRSQPRPSQ